MEYSTLKRLLQCLSNAKFILSFINLRSFKDWILQANLKKRCERIAESKEGDLDVYDGIDLVFQHISELMYDNGIIIDDLIQ